MMIRINLLPVEKSGPKRAYTQLALMLVMLVGAGAIIGYFWVKQNNTIEQNRVEIAEKKKIVQQLKETIKKVKEFEQMKQRIKRKLDIIADAKQQQHLPVYIMSDFIEAIPDQIWIRTFNWQGMRMQVQGLALSFNSIGNFMAAIDSARFFRAAELQSAAKTKMGNQEVINFKIDFRLAYNKFMKSFQKKEG